KTPKNVQKFPQTEISIHRDKPIDECADFVRLPRPKETLFMSKHLFTSESVSMGHPDKMADQISDSILDAMLEQDPKSRVACETLITTGLVVVAGEITTTANIDFQHVVREAIKRTGYDDARKGFDYQTCGVTIALDKQSPDISQGVSEGE